MTFYNWMKKNYKDDDTVKGDFVENMERDKGFPLNSHPGKYDGWFEIIFRHLVNTDACDEALDVFEECWRGYVNECKRKKHRTKVG